MKFFFQTAQRVYTLKTAGRHITLYDAYIEIFGAIFTAVLYTVAEPAHIFKTYHIGQIWKSHPYSDSTRLAIGKFIFACIAAPCAIGIAIIFATTFIIMIPILILLYLIAYFLDR